MGHWCFSGLVAWVERPWTDFNVRVLPHSLLQITILISGALMLAGYRYSAQRKRPDNSGIMPRLLLLSGVPAGGIDLQMPEGS